MWTQFECGFWRDPSVRLNFLWIFPGSNGGEHTRGVLSGPLRPFLWRSTWPDLAERDEQNSFWELDWYWLLLIRFLSSLQGAEFRHFSERKAKPPPADRYMKLANWVWGAPEQTLIRFLCLITRRSNISQLQLFHHVCLGRQLGLWLRSAGGVSKPWGNAILMHLCFAAGLLAEIRHRGAVRLPRACFKWWNGLFTICRPKRRPLLTAESFLRCLLEKHDLPKSLWNHHFP